MFVIPASSRPRDVADAAMRIAFATAIEDDETALFGLVLQADLECTPPGHCPGHQANRRRSA